MPAVAKHIMEHAEALPEATPICAKALLHFGSRAAVDQALSRLVRDGRLDRICRGVHMRPVRTRFGLRSPHLDEVLTRLGALWGETIVPSGGAAANVLGLTMQNQIVTTCLTSGRNRELWFGATKVRLFHAPRWKLVAANRPAGTVVRALAWLGREETHRNLSRACRHLSGPDRIELLSLRPMLPTWMAIALGEVLARG